MGKDLQNLAPHFVEILSGDEKGRRIELGERLTIGRSDGSDIVVKSDGVSRNHALILSGEDGLKIQDTGSKNGILVNGSRQTEVVLRSGDIFQVGESVFRVGSSIQPQSQDVSHREEEDGNNSVEGHSEELAEPVQPIPQLEAPMATPRFSGASKRVPLYLGLAIFVGFAYWFANEGSLETPARKGASSSSPATSDDSRIAVLETNTEQGGSEQGETATAKALVAKPPTTLSPEMKWSEENSSKLDWSDSGLREA